MKDKFLLAEWTRSKKLSKKSKKGIQPQMDADGREFEDGMLQFIRFQALDLRLSASI